MGCVFEERGERERMGEREWEREREEREETAFACENSDAARR